MNSSDLSLAARRASESADAAAKEAAIDLSHDQMMRVVRRRREAADREAADLVADQAEQDATATRYHAEAAAIRIGQAAEVAAVAALQGESNPISPAAQLRAANVAAVVQAAAAAQADETAELAGAMARMVEARAVSVAATQGAVLDAIEAEVASAPATNLIQRSRRLHIVLPTM